MNIRNSRYFLLWYEGAGFLSLIALSWMDEFWGLQQFVFGGPEHETDWRDVTMETLLILLVWCVVFLFTHRLLKRLLYLEGFLRVCAWCRRINYKESWIRVEDFFATGFKVETTHGMCPECFKSMEEDTAEYRRKEQTRPP